MEKKVLLRVTVCLMLQFLLLTGCTYRLADMTVLSTRNVTLNKVDLDTLPQVRGIKGIDSKFTFLFIPLGFPHLENAVDDALEKGGGDVMTDVTIQTEVWTMLIFGQNSISVKGNVVKTRGVDK